MRLSLAMLLLVLSAMPACSDDFVPCATAPADFDGHIQRWFDSEDDLAAWCKVGKTSSTACKFLIPVFEASLFDARHVHHADVRGGVEFMDPNFYRLHDEWWWFHLLNGAPLDGCPRRPLTGGPRYDTVDDVYLDLFGNKKLPLGLSNSGSRLYSNEFYGYMLSACMNCDENENKMCAYNTCPRVIAGGTLSFYPADPSRPVPEAFWAFQVYRDDRVNADEVTRYFTRLRQALPKDVAANLRWLARAQDMQEDLVDRFRACGDAMAKYVLKVDDIVAPGQVTIYNPGYAAGHIKRVADGEAGSASLSQHDLVVLESVPDDLPPVAAIVTAEPQTAQAHLNLLAKGRGTPNAFVAGSYANPELADYPSWKWMALRLQAGTATWRPMTSEEADEYKVMLATSLRQVPMIELDGAPLWVDLSGEPSAAVAPIALVGGKVAGLRALFFTPDLHLPHNPMAITVAGYGRHIDPLMPTIKALLDDKKYFQKSAYARHLLLDGRAAFQAEYGNDVPARIWLKLWTKNVLSLPPALREVYNVGGLKAMIANRPIDPVWLAQVRDKLTARFADLSPKQGLRFRSSATVEDIEGFNGAGIYASFTGWLDPAAAGKSKKSTVERAIARTWASYWSFGAFSERRAAHIDHLTGRMAVLVHPRFDAALEANNGVILVRLERQADGARRIVTEVNVQQGSTSVTNPKNEGDLPEVDHIIQEPGDAPKLKRMQASTLLKKGQFIMTEDELLAMHNKVVAVAHAWLADLNDGLPAARRRLTLQLDLEFRKVHPGWPALGSGKLLPERFVYKQSRTLMPVLGVKASDLGGLVAPTDLLAATIKVERRLCAAQDFEFESVEFTTAPSLHVFAHAQTPFINRIRLRLAAGLLPTGGLPQGETLQANHVALASFKHPTFGKAGYRVELRLTDAQAKAWAWRELVVEDGGNWQIKGDKSPLAAGAGVTCTVVLVKRSAKSWLASLFEPI